MKEKKKSIEVSIESTLFEILSSNLRDISNKKIKSYLKYKMVEVDGIITTNGSTIVKPGSLVIIYFTKKILPVYDLRIIYEDKDLIAIDKPSGLLSISNSKEKELTAFRLVSDYVKTQNKNSKIFVVHRLDQGTSGVLLFSKNLKLKEKLQKNWGDLVLKREYVAVLEGETPPRGTIKNYLTMNHFQIVHSTKDTEKGHFAITHYKTIKYKNKRSLVEVNIDTGRRNQIRAHMSEAGNPVVGDKKYGAKTNPINRIALHASKLYLIDPRTSQVLEFKSPVPKELKRLVL